MKLFDITNDKVQLNPQTLYVPEFKKLWDRDKTTDKSKCHREISHIVFLLDNSTDNPYMHYSEDDRKKILDIDFPIVMDEVIQNAMNKFNLLNTSRYEKVVMAALETLEAVESYYKDITLQAKNKQEFDIKELLMSMKDLGAAFKQLKELERQLQADRMEDSKVRGSSEIGMYEL